MAAAAPIVLVLNRERSLWLHSGQGFTIQTTLLDFKEPEDSLVYVFVACIWPSGELHLHHVADKCHYDRIKGRWRRNS